jgi:hypothetical protein
MFALYSNNTADAGVESIVIAVLHVMGSGTAWGTVTKC